MAAGDTATVFLETTLGTRLVVSFPARATTVADLKRQVSAEHAAGFPDARPIAVTSLQVNLDGSWFQLTDSMAVRAAFDWVKGPWRLRAMAHELVSHPHARRDAKCGTSDAEPSGGSSQYMLPPAASQGSGSLDSGDGISDTPQMNQQDKPQEGVELAVGQCKDGIAMSRESSDIDLAAGDCDTPHPNQEDKPQECVERAAGQRKDGIAISRESSDIDLAAGDCDTPQPNQEDKPQECVEQASGQLEDGIPRPQESSEFDFAAGGSDTPPMDQQDKSHEAVERASVQSEDRTTMIQESSVLGVAADKGKGAVVGQQKDTIAESRGKKRLWEDDKTNESIAVNCGENLSSLASSTLDAELPNKKSSVTAQAKSNSASLRFNLEDHSNDLGEMPSGGQEEASTSGVHNGESSKNGSDIPPSVETMERDKSSDKEVKPQRDCGEKPWIAGCAGESSCTRTDVPRCAESLKEDGKKPASSGYYRDKGKNEGATSTVSKEHKPYFRGSHHRVAVRKVSVSRAMKMYSFRC